MAGQKIVHRYTTEDNYRDENGKPITGLPITEIIENGNIEPDDEWALFRLTNDGLVAYYKIGYEVAACIMSLLIKNQPAVVEVSRFKTKEEAVKAKGELSPEEQHRTLLRSVRLKK